jgi:hypothetical protein
MGQSLTEGGMGGVPGWPLTGSRPGTLTVTEDLGAFELARLCHIAVHPPSTTRACPVM